MATLAAWAQQTDVLNVTGIAVDDSTVEMAQGIIEIVTHREFGMGRFRPRDLRWLKRAVAYQAAWMTFQADLFTRSNFRLLQQDGMVIQPNEKVEAYLAPLAKRALKNCSWMRSRSLRMRTSFVDGDVNTNPLVDDSTLNWEPM